LKRGLGVYFPSETVKAAERLVKIFHGKILISDELSRRDALLLAIYMLSNKKGSPTVPREDVEKFYTEAGRDVRDKKHTTEFSKALYDLAKAAKRPLVKRRGDNLSLTSAGLSRVGGLLAPEEK